MSSFGKYVNLGCGSRYHPDWINIDIVPSGSGVIAHDLSQSVPLPDASCDVVYHSHLLEHMRKPDAIRFMQECHRVLRPNGVLRVVVPDLERICRTYLEKLENALKANATSAHDYDWIMLEMYDQVVREKSGGEMLAYLSQSPLPNESFVYERIGEEGRNIVRTIRAQAAEVANPPHNSMRYAALNSLQSMRQRLRSLPDVVRNVVLKNFGGQDASRALSIGRFRLAGEVHQWMYDRYSLARLMLAVGFQNPTQQSATQSRIPEWFKFNLDTQADMTVNKPDSLFMEAVKPCRM